MTRGAVGLLALSLLFGCSDSTGPIEVAPIYALVTADGHTMPWRSYRVVGETGCVADLLDSHITFSDSGRYEFTLSTRLSCTDGVHPPSLAISQGSYTREGNSIILDPDVTSTYAIGMVRLQKAGLTAVLSTSGQQYQLVYRAGF